MKTDRPLRIAQVAPPWIPTPPAAFGGVEAVVATLTDRLIERGHDVELFGAAGSRAAGPVHAPLPREYSGTAIGRWGIEAEYAGRVVEQLASAATPFDVVHDHSGYVLTAFAQFVGAPVVHTMHSALSPDPARFYAHHGRKATLVGLSRAQLSCAAGTCRRADPERDGPPHPLDAHVVPNGLDLAEWPVGTERDDYLLWIGRLQKIKGAHTAIEVAKRAGRRLILAGPLQVGSAAYFTERIEPHVDGEQIVYVGEVDAARKRELYARAHALLNPIEWCEPHGLVMTEMLACNGPVLATREGAAVEIVQDGVNGFLADEVGELAERVADVRSLDPRACRASVAERYSAEAMVAGYERIYREVVSGRTS